MHPENQIDKIADRAEKLLLLHAELQQRQAALEQKLSQTQQERDALALRLEYAAARLDSLLEQLPHPKGDAA